MTATLACGADGDLLAFDFSGDFNTGAYSSWGPTVANRVPIHASGPYRLPNVRALTRAVLTNNTVAGAFRGFGVPQSTLLGEVLIDELAAPAASIRSSSAIATPCAPATARRPGSGSTRASACVPASTRCARPGRNRCAGRRVQCSCNPRRRAAAPRRRHRLHVVRHRQHRHRQSVDDARRACAGNGRFFLYNGAQEIGQGTATIMPQMFADAVGLPLALSSR